MEEIYETIQTMGGRLNLECYRLLCMAIKEARERQPEVPQMKELWGIIQKKAQKKKATAVSKALERAVADLWENGDREMLGRYQRNWEYEKPYPKEFI